MRKTIVSGGGVEVVTGDETSYRYKRFEEWYKLDPERAVAEALGDLERGNGIVTRGELTRRLARSFGLAAYCTPFLSELHRRMAGAIVATVECWAATHPDRARDMHVEWVNGTHPANYTPEMSRLKNLRFAGWDGSAVKGFCVFEPAVRVRQLLAFPIAQFTDVDLPNPFSRVTALDAVVLPSNDSKDVVDVSTAERARAAIESVRADVERWEAGVVDACDALRHAADEIRDATQERNI